MLATTSPNDVGEGIYACSHIDKHLRQAEGKMYERSSLNVQMMVICGHREGIAMATAALSCPVETGGEK